MDDDKPKRGRPPKLTSEIALGIATSILDGNFRYVAAQSHGVLPERLRKWMQAGKRFPDGVYGELRWLVLEAEAEAERAAVARVLFAGRTVDAKHLQWWLERKFPQRWGRFRGELVELRREVKEIRELLRREAGHQEPPPGAGGAEGDGG